MSQSAEYSWWVLTEQPGVLKITLPYNETVSLIMFQGKCIFPGLHLFLTYHKYVSNQSLCGDEVGVDGWVKHGTFTQETAVHVLCETKSQLWLILIYARNLNNVTNLLILS